MSKFKSNQKLWTVEKNVSGYYYIIKANGMVIDKVKIEEPAYSFLKKAGEI